MKVALVHDYLNEFGGAERVLLALSEIFPNAPIYTSFYKKDSPAFERFRGKKIVTSWVHKIPLFDKYLHSPLRFLAPLIWNSFDFRSYDLIIGSSSWYVTKGFTKKGKDTIEICYCHTPPRWLYGYKTSIELQKYFPVRVYAAIVGHFMRMYDFNAAQRVDYFIANSKNTAARIKKFYRREATVIYPPVDIPTKIRAKKGDYYLVLSRIVGGKGIDLAIKTAVKLGLKLKVAGKPAGYYTEYKKLQKLAKNNIEFLGYVSDRERLNLLANAKAFLALSEDEDFGITPVEAMSVGTPVVAYKGGGYLESVVEGKTGIFFNKSDVENLSKAIKKLEEVSWDKEQLFKNSQRFSKGRFKKRMLQFVRSHAKKK